MAGLDDPLLPPEMWREILGRLPVKSILRCRSVCKSWYSLVSCSDFITNLHNKNGNRVLLYLKDFKTGCLSLSSHDESCMESCSCEHDDDCPRQLYAPGLTIVGSCDGLICLSRSVWSPLIDYFSTTVTFLIWNPAIRKIVDLPSLTECHVNQRASLVGFGFDSNTSDYKVMCNLRNDDFEVIDLKTGVWRIVSPRVPSGEVSRRVAECYVDGAVHWSVSRNVEGVGRVILSFNMSYESFREIRMPDSAEFNRSGDDYRVESRCVAFGGLLHVIAWKNKLDGDADVLENCSVWAMKEYGVTESWIEVSNVDFRGGQVWPSTRIRPDKYDFILWVKHEILMVHNLVGSIDNLYKWDLVLYNTEDRKSKRIFSTTKWVESMCLYKESLVLI